MFIKDVLDDNQPQISESSLGSDRQTSMVTVCGDEAFATAATSSSNNTEPAVLIKREHEDRGEKSSLDGRISNEMSTRSISLDTAAETTQLQAVTTTLSEPGDSQDIDGDDGSPMVVENVERIQARKS
jgi:hypothetical protein